MSDEKTNTSEEGIEDQKKPLTPEQEKELRDRAMAFYEGELPTLRLQAEYEKLHAEIAEANYKQLVANAKIGQVHMEQARINAEYKEAQENVAKGLQPDGSSIPKESEKKPERKLATE